MFFKPDNVLQNSPEFCKALKLVIKFQISSLLEQLAESGEESIVITANIGEGTADHLGSNKGSSFLEARDELQRQFLSYCTDPGTITKDMCRKPHTSSGYGDETFASHLLSPSQIPCSPLLSPSSYHKAGPVRSRYERESSTSDSVFSPHRRKSSASSRSLEEENLFTSAEYHEKKTGSELDTCFREWPIAPSSLPLESGDKMLKYYPVKSPSCDDSNRVLTLSSPSEFQYRKQTKSVARLSVSSVEHASVSSTEKISPSPSRISNSSSSSEMSESLQSLSGQGQKSNSCQRSPNEQYKPQSCPSSVFPSPAPPTPTTPTISVEEAVSTDNSQNVYKMPYEPTDLKSPYSSAEPKFRYGTYETDHKYTNLYNIPDIKDRKATSSGEFDTYSIPKADESNVYGSSYSYKMPHSEGFREQHHDAESAVFKRESTCEDVNKLQENEKISERQQEMDTSIGNTGVGKDKVNLSPDYRAYSFGLLSPLQRSFLYGGRGINRERSQSLSEVVNITQEDLGAGVHRARFPSSSFVENLDTPLIIDDDTKVESESYEGLDLTKKRRKLSDTYQPGEEHDEMTPASELGKMDDKELQDTSGYQSGAGLESSVKKYGKGNFIKVATGYQCRICCRVIRHMNNTTAHMRIHANLKPYKCQVCHQQFKYEVDRRYHFSKQHVDLFAKMYFPDGEKKPDQP